MRQTAKITVIVYDRKFRLYLYSHGDPVIIREFVRKGLRGNRRDISHEPERLMWRCYDILRNRTVSMTVFPIPDPVWRYTFDITTDTIATVRYTNDQLGIDQKYKLFSWLGSERRSFLAIPNLLKSSEPPKAEPNPEIRRGRRSATRQFEEPLPEEFKEDYQSPKRELDQELRERMRAARKRTKSGT
jgi:hypothetical protein